MPGTAPADSAPNPGHPEDVVVDAERGLNPSAADIAEGVGKLDERLRLRVTVTLQAPGCHGRVYLDRAYLEVAAHLGSPA